VVAQEDSGQGSFAKFGQVRHHLGVKRLEINNATEGKLEAREVTVSQSTIVRRITIFNSDVEGRAEVPAGCGPPLRAEARLLENGTGTLKHLLDVRSATLLVADRYGVLVSCLIFKSLAALISSGALSE
jgi:hypothetical protein